MPCSAENVIKFVRADEISYGLYERAVRTEWNSNWNRFVEVAVQNNNRSSLKWIIIKANQTDLREELNLLMIVKLAVTYRMHDLVQWVLLVLSHPSIGTILVPSYWYYPFDAEINTDRQNIFQYLASIGQSHVVAKFIGKLCAMDCDALYVTMRNYDMHERTFFHYSLITGNADVFIAVSANVFQFRACIFANPSIQPARQFIDTRATYSQMIDFNRKTQSTTGSSYTRDISSIPTLIKNWSADSEFYISILSSVRLINYVFRFADVMTTFRELITVAYIETERCNLACSTFPDLHRQDYESLMFAVEYDPIDVSLAQSNFSETWKFCLNTDRRLLTDDWIRLSLSFTLYSNCILHAAVCFGRIDIVKYILALQLSTVDLKSKETVINAAIGVSVYHHCDEAIESCRKRWNAIVARVFICGEMTSLPSLKVALSTYMIGSVQDELQSDSDYPSMAKFLNHECPVDHPTFSNQWYWDPILEFYSENKCYDDDLRAGYWEPMPWGSLNMVRWLLFELGAQAPPIFQIISCADRFISAWYVTYRMEAHKLVKQKFDGYMEIGETILSYLYCDYKEYPDSVLDKVLRLNPESHGVKCLHLTQILVEDFQANVFLPSIVHCKGNTALHVAIEFRQLLCIAYFSNMPQLLICKSSNGMLPTESVIEIHNFDPIFIRIHKNMTEVVFQKFFCESDKPAEDKMVQSALVNDTASINKKSERIEPVEAFAELLRGDSELVALHRKAFLDDAVMKEKKNRLADDSKRLTEAFLEKLMMNAWRDDFNAIFLSGLDHYEKWKPFLNGKSLSVILEERMQGEISLFTYTLDTWTTFPGILKAVIFYGNGHLVSSFVADAEAVFNPSEFINYINDALLTACMVGDMESASLLLSKGATYEGASVYLKYFDTETDLSLLEYVAERLHYNFVVALFPLFEFPNKGQKVLEACISLHLEEIAYHYRALGDFKTILPDSVYFGRLESKADNRELIIRFLCDNNAIDIPNPSFIEKVIDAVKIFKDHVWHPDRLDDCKPLVWSVYDIRCMHDLKLIDLLDNEFSRRDRLFSFFHEDEEFWLYNLFSARSDEYFLPELFEGGDLLELQSSLQSANDARAEINENKIDLSLIRIQGMPLIHYTAFRGFANILRWLVVDNGLDVDSVDSKGRTTFECVEKMPKSANEKIIIELNKLKAMKEENTKNFDKVMIRFKSYVRGYLVRKILADTVKELSGDHYGPWKSVVTHLYLFDLANSKLSLPSAEVRRCRVIVSSLEYWSSWSDLRAKDSMIVTPYIEPELSNIDTTDTVVDDEDYLADSSVTNEFNNVTLLTPVSAPDSLSSSVAVRYDTEIHLSHAVLTWMRQMAGNRLVYVFSQRVEQLAQGDRSYCLSKPLKHCPAGLRFTLFETKLDAGQRILWTDRESERKSSSKPSILIWYVSKHDKVSHYVSLIDQSFCRLNIHSPGMSSVSHASGSVTSSTSASFDFDDQVLIDPIGINILKTYVVNVSSLKCIHEDDWTPPLRMTNQVSISIHVVLPIH